MEKAWSTMPEKLTVSVKEAPNQSKTQRWQNEDKDTEAYIG